MSVAVLLYLTFGTVHSYVSGPLVIRAEGRTHLTARRAAVVESVEIKPAQHVAEGDVLVRFNDAEETADLARLQHELELQLVRMLRDPTDQSARTALTSLYAQRERAEAQTRERVLRAPHVGIVHDVRVRPGQSLAPGDMILTLIREDARFTAVAMMPGYARPQLYPGMPLRLELEGFSYEYQRLLLSDVSEEVIGPTEVRRFLGPEVADAVQVNGAVTLVSAKLPSGSFLAGGRTYRLYDGMLGRAEARVKTESILLTLLPGLRAAFKNSDVGSTRR
jgi:membrane fusion protein (multidrug efflux system)